MRVGTMVYRVRVRSKVRASLIGRLASFPCSVPPGLTLERAATSISAHLANVAPDWCHDRAATRGECDRNNAENPQSD
jgi:hypothetical protein